MTRKQWSVLLDGLLAGLVLLGGVAAVVLIVDDFMDSWTASSWVGNVFTYGLMAGWWRAARSRDRYKAALSRIMARYAECQALKSGLNAVVDNLQRERRHR